MIVGRTKESCAGQSACQVINGAENTREHVDLTTSAQETGGSAVTRWSLVTSLVSGTMYQAACMPMVRGAQVITRSASIHGTVTQMEEPTMDHVEQQPIEPTEPLEVLPIVSMVSE